MNTDTDYTILALRAELDRARARFPKNDHLFAALGEEVGELARELLEGGTRERIRGEAIQVACVAIRIADEGDGDFPASAPVETRDEMPCGFVSDIGETCTRDRRSYRHFHSTGRIPGHAPRIFCHPFTLPEKPE